jgi:hypothetical protein
VGPHFGLMMNGMHIYTGCHCSSEQGYCVRCEPEPAAAAIRISRSKHRVDSYRRSRALILGGSPFTTQMTNRSFHQHQLSGGVPISFSTPSPILLDFAAALTFASAQLHLRSPLQGFQQDSLPLFHANLEPNSNICLAVVHTRSLDCPGVNHSS